jgi:hypothetical protein
MVARHLSREQREWVRELGVGGLIAWRRQLTDDVNRGRAGRGELRYRMTRCVGHVELASLEDNAVTSNPQWLYRHIALDVQVRLGPLHSHLNLLAERRQLDDEVRWTDESRRRIF